MGVVKRQVRLWVERPLVTEVEMVKGRAGRPVDDEITAVDTYTIEKFSTKVTLPPPIVIYRPLYTTLMSKSLIEASVNVFASVRRQSMWVSVTLSCA